MIALSLGTNVGDRIKNLSTAISLLQRYLSDLRVSSIYACDALLPPNAPESWNMPFFNMAVAGNTDLSPPHLLQKLQEIEHTMGRETNHPLWSPRIIDIDIMIYGDLISRSKELNIPHKGLLNRDFFYLPCAEICPDWSYPEPGQYYGKTLHEIVKSKAELPSPQNTKKTDIRITL